MTFTKGQNVKKIASWGHGDNNLMQWYVQDCIVTAAGKKQMTLVDVHTGKPVGSTYKPTEEQRIGLVKDCTMDEAKAIALVRAEQELAERLKYMRERAARTDLDQWYANNAREELAKLEACKTAVVTPYEPGHQYGPKEGEVIEQHKPRQKGTTYLARYEGQIVGKRVSHNPYTHAVVIKKADGTIIAPSFSRSLANAQKLQPYNGTVIAIVPVEVK